MVRSPVFQILHNTVGIGATSFGVGQVTLNLTREQNLLGYDARIWCMSDAADISWAADSGDVPLDRISGFPSTGPRQLGCSLRMARCARGSEGKRFHIVHQHGIWTGCSYVTHLLHQHHNTPYVIAVHGSLQAWALQRSRWKKTLALIAYERTGLRQAACLHATAESEIADFRNFGLRAPIALIRNGVSERWLNSAGDGDSFRAMHGIPPDRRILFFLSRITPKKGLTMLIKAIHALRASFDGWILVIAGTDEFDHKAEVSALVEQLNLKDKVKMIGPLFNQAKRDAFAAAGLFILPSYSEGSPIVILDSLAAGVPVITTKGAPWQDLATHQCGWWTEISVGSLLDALQEALSTSQDSLDAMGKRGRALVASQYSWPVLAQKTVELYEWILGQQNKPDFVICD